MKKIYDGTVKEVADHVLVDIPEISDHMWFEEGMNLICYIRHTILQKMTIKWRIDT